MNDATTTTTETHNSKTGLADSIREHFSGDAPLTDKLTGFAKARPWASAALAGTAAVVLFNSLRGNRS